MAIQELTTPGQFTFSASQGWSGVRRWVVDGCEDIEAFIDQLCTTNWPDKPSVLPTSITCGPFDEKASFAQKPAGGGGVSVYSNLPTYNKYLVVAQYQHQRLSDSWPTIIPKLVHPKGTALSLEVKGGVQFLLVSPTALLGFTDESMTTKVPLQQFLTPTGNSRIQIPIVEYHVSCDRMTADDVDTVFGPAAWDYLTGYVNSEPCLGVPAGCLMFESWTMNQTFVPATEDPERFRLTAVFKARTIVRHVSPGTDYRGWNWDYVLENGKGGWRMFGVLNNVDGGDAYVPRYPDYDLNGILGGT
jgi:hypothetical protein